MLTLTFEFKLKPTKKQVEDIENILTVCRRVWNYALRERKDWVNSRKCKVNACSLEYEYIMKAEEPFPNYHIQAKRLTDAKKTYPELKTVNAQVLQQVLRTLDRAWEEMKSRKFGFPRFKKQLFRMKSFVFPQLKGELIKGNKVKLPQLGWVKFHQSRPLPDGFVIKQARVVRKASGYFVMLSLQLDVNVPDIPFHGHPVGIDIGLESFLATSEGQLIARPKFFEVLHCQLKLLQRRLKNKKFGSNNRKKLNYKIARIHQKISDIRKDFHFKTANKLCDQAGAIFVEDIDFRTWSKGMFCKHNGTCFKSAKPPNAVPPLDAGFSQFFTILSYVAWKRGVYFGKVDKAYTSQTCPECGTLTGKKDLSLRIHYCPECGYTTNRDVAAAQVIKNKGVSALLDQCLALASDMNPCGRAARE